MAALLSPAPARASIPPPTSRSYRVHVIGQAQGQAAPSLIEETDLEHAIMLTHGSGATCSLNGYDAGLSYDSASPGTYVLTQFNQEYLTRTGRGEFLDIGFTLDDKGRVGIAYVRSALIGPQDGRNATLDERYAHPDAAMARELERLVRESVAALLSCEYGTDRPAASSPALRATQERIYPALAGSGLVSGDFAQGLVQPTSK